MNFIFSALFLYIVCSAVCVLVIAQDSQRLQECNQRLIITNVNLPFISLILSTKFIQMTFKPLRDHQQNLTILAPDIPDFLPLEIIKKNCVVKVT